MDSDTDGQTRLGDRNNESMVIHEKPLEFYIEKLKNEEYFSQGMFGDGEWIAIFQERLGRTNAEGTIYDPQLCEDLINSLKFKSDNFFFSTPSGIKSIMGEIHIDNFLRTKEVKVEFYEKDMWDLAMKSGELVNFMNQLRQMRVVLIGNSALRQMEKWLNYDAFFEISYPNCYLDGSLDEAVRNCLAYGQPAVYFFSAGLPAALAVQKLHGQIPNSWFLDVGSIWDTFCRIGAQRGFRAELYADPERYSEWLKKYEDAIV